MRTKERVIRPRRGLVGLDLKELISYWELLLFFTWRDILVRYKQTAIGILWAILQPLFMMVVFTLIFGKLAGLPSDGVPYPVMTYCALLPWMFFANSMSLASNSVVGAASMISKIYFPRVIIPASTILSGVVDFLISFVILLFMMMAYEVEFRVELLWLPVFFLIAMLTSFGVSLWLSALNVKFRDVKHIVPFIVRMGMFVSPVAYISSVIPEAYDYAGITWPLKYLYSLNPLVGVIDGFRWAILGPQFEPDWQPFALSIAMVFLLFFTGAYYFRREEARFADII